MELIVSISWAKDKVRAGFFMIIITQGAKFLEERKRQQRLEMVLN